MGVRVLGSCPGAQRRPAAHCNGDSHHLRVFPPTQRGVPPALQGPCGATRQHCLLEPNSPSNGGRHSFEDGGVRRNHHDESVQFKFVCIAVAKLIMNKVRDKSQLMLQTSASAVNSFLKQLVDRHALEPVLHPVHLYRLRHGGASHAFATGLMNLQVIQRAGRWRSIKSLHRYEKGGRLAQLSANMPEDLQMMTAPQKLMAYLNRL